MPAFEVYKSDQAVTSRWILAICAGSLLLFGCNQLFYSLPDAARGHLFGVHPLGDEFPVSFALIASLVVGVAGLIGLWLAVNHPRLVDFLAETEVEMTKVAWSSRKEVVGSSVVVVATVVILGGGCSSWT